jgi:hypothetical protein
MAPRVVGAGLGRRSRRRDGFKRINLGGRKLHVHGVEGSQVFGLRGWALVPPLPPGSKLPTGIFPVLSPVSPLLPPLVYLLPHGFFVKPSLFQWDAMESFRFFEALSAVYEPGPGNDE